MESKEDASLASFMTLPFQSIMRFQTPRNLLLVSL